MAVTETLRGLGSWEIELSANTPKDLLDKLQYYGHIAIHTGRVDYRKEGDAALTSSRYTGVLRKKDSEETTLIGGPGMAMWLGDEDHKGDVYEDTKTFTNTPFEETLRQLLPASGSVTEGTFFNIDKTYTGTFKFVSPREAIDYVCETLGADWYVAGDGKLYAGLEGDLFRIDPRALLIRREGGVDMSLRGLRGAMKTEQDVEDFTTRVLLLAEGEGKSTATATADIDPAKNPYRNLAGNPVAFTRIVSETATESTNAEARAQLQLNRFSGTRDAITLSTAEYDLKGDVVVGDYIWVYDPELKLYNLDNEITFRGKRYNPISLRLTEMTWPIVNKMSVGFRDWDGNWYNLTDYLIPESGETTLVVGGYNRSLTSAGGSAGSGGQGGGTPQPNTTIPGKVVWTEPFQSSIYQSPTSGETRAQVQLAWTRPNNTNGSTILDGDHWEIRWRSSATPIFPVTWAQLELYSWEEIEKSGATWEKPIQYEVGDWQYAYVPWSELSFLLADLAPNMPYEAQIRAVDGATPANTGEWSDLAVFQSNYDTIPPTQPAPPEVAASMAAVQVVHRLGRSDGGEYNLDRDLHHIEIHGGGDQNFLPTNNTLLGKLIANAGMLEAGVPAVATFPLDNLEPVWFKAVAVDNDGNKSPASVAVQQSAELIDDAHISSLTVSKITSGTITADWFLGAKIATGKTGSRVEIDTEGIRLYNDAGEVMAQMNAETGSFDAIGQLASGDSGRYMVINPVASGVPIPEIRFYPQGPNSNYSYLNAPSVGDEGIAGIGINTGLRADGNQYTAWVSDAFAIMGRTNLGGTRDGGYFWANDSYTRVGWHRESDGVDFYHGVASDGMLSWQGYVWQGNPVGSRAAVFYDWVASSAGNVRFTWGATMLGTMSVVGSFTTYGTQYNRDVIYQTFNIDATGFNSGTGVGAVNGRHTVICFRTL